MAPAFPTLRWVALLWLAVWFPAYWRVWGWQNFLQLCDLAVFLTCLGLWRGSALLLSSQAVGAIVVNAVWTLDVAWRAAVGRHLIGGTEYMWDTRFPLWVRLLSLYHVVLPVLLVWAVRRVGYDARGWKLQAAIAAGALVVTRLAGPAVNYNAVYRDPILGQTWGPVPVHLAFMLLCLVAAVYWPTHAVLQRSLLPWVKGG
jgi:hypothetical protein